MAQCNNAWGGREDALLQQKLEQCEALYDSLIAEKAQNSRLQAEIARHKQRADAAERSTAALQRELQARQVDNPADGYSSYEVMMLQKKLEKRSAELDMLQQEVTELQQQLKEMAHRAEDSEAAAAAYRQEYLRLFQQLATSLSIRQSDEGAGLPGDHHSPASTDLAARLASMYHDHRSLSGSSRSSKISGSDRSSGSRSSALVIGRSSCSSASGRSVGDNSARSHRRSSGHSSDAFSAGAAEGDLSRQAHYMAAVVAEAAAVATDVELSKSASERRDGSGITDVQRAAFVTCASSSAGVDTSQPAAAAASTMGVLCRTAGAQEGCRDMTEQRSKRAATTAVHPPSTPSTTAAPAAATAAAPMMQHTWRSTISSKIPLPPPVSTAEPVMKHRNAAAERARRSEVRSSMRASLSMSPELVFVWRSVQDDD